MEDSGKEEHIVHDILNDKESHEGTDQISSNSLEWDSFLDNAIKQILYIYRNNTDQNVRIDKLSVYTKEFFQNCFLNDLRLAMAHIIVTINNEVRLEYLTKLLCYDLERFLKKQIVDIHSKDISDYLWVSIFNQFNLILSFYRRIVSKI